MNAPPRRLPSDQSAPDPLAHELNHGQRLVVDYPASGRHMLVLAPPGSGKTLTITHRIARLLRSKEAAAESVLALTFTERAASELAARLHALSLHGVTARTFHGHCSTLLRTHHREAGFSEAFSVFTDQQLEQAQMEAIGSLRLSRLPGRHVGSIRRTLSQYVCEPLSLEEAALRSSLSILQFEALIERYEAIKREQKAIDFDDLIVRTANLLWNTSEVADSIHDRCRFVFVDEFQDVSPEQLRLLNALAPHQLDNRQVVVVADENQSIYAFRGADPGTMLRRYRELYRPSEFTLEENRRSVASIVRAAQRLMRAADADERSKPWRGEGHRVLGFACDHEVHEADYVAHLVERAIGEGFSPSHIAVLYRRHERGEVIENALLKRSIRLFRVQKGRFYDLPDVQETIRSLELVTSSQDRSFVNAVNWPRFLVDELTMISLRRITEDLGIGLAAIGEQREILRERCSPLTATIVEQFFADVVHPVRAMESEEPARVVEGMLDLLECRRSPIPVEVRSDFRSTLDELGKGLEAAVEAMTQAIFAGKAIRVSAGNTADGARASRLLQRVLGRYFRLDCETQESALDTHRFDIEELGDSAGEFTCTARAWRFSQFFLMKHETLDQERFVVYDLETTSDRPNLAEILDIGAVVIQHGQPTGEEFTSRVRPSSPEIMTEAAFRVHGIRWEDVREAPEPAGVLTAFRRFAGSDTLAGHNIQRFDTIVLNSACDRSGLPRFDQPFLDTFQLARRLRPGLPNSLDDLLTDDERRRRGLHGALQDARLNAMVLTRLMRNLQREREIDVLNEELPQVAASFDLLPGPLGPDARLLRELGARVLAFAGMAKFPVPKSGDDDLLAVRERARTVDTGDPQWERLRRGWRGVVRNFEAVSRGLSMAEFMDLVALATPSDLDDGDPDRVSLMTIYAAKGKEWPIVFMVGLEDDQYPYSSNARQNEVDEGRRSLYVGMTRATDRLFLSHCAVVDDKPRSPSRFIADIGEDVVWKRPHISETRP